MLIPRLLSYFWQVSERHLEQQYLHNKRTRYAITIRTPIEFPNGDQTVRVRGIHVYAGGYHKRNDETRYPLATHQTLERKKTSIHIHQRSYFDIKWSFLICFRDKADRHTPILIEDENLFTAFDDLLLDDT